MATWREFQKQRPDLASAGRDLLYQVGIGLAFLATVRVDGGPRLNPMCPVLADDRLFAFIVPGPKCRALERDVPYAMLSFPCGDNAGASIAAGSAVAVDASARRARLVA